MKGGVDTHGRQGGLLFSSASSKGYVVSSLDISNAYFQGEEMDRLLILKPPKGTDLEGLSEDDSISWPEYPSTGLTMPEENYGNDSGST